MRRRPVWPSALRYYLLAAVAAAAAFVMAWGVLYDGGEESPWLGGIIVGATFLVFSVLLREIVLRRKRNRYLSADKEFDRSLRTVYARVDRKGSRSKLTLERNATILLDIKKKSDAAVVLGKFAEGHREVFELCGEYLATVDREFSTIGAGSPRFSPLKKSRDSVAEFHRYHLMQWAAIQARSLTQDASSLPEAADRIESAQEALDVVDAALGFYPDEPKLIESRELVVSLLTSLKVSQWVEKAERAEFDGDLVQAKHYYRDALFYLSREAVPSSEHENAASQINTQIERLARLTDRS